MQEESVQSVVYRDTSIRVIRVIRGFNTSMSYYPQTRCLTLDEFPAVLDVQTLFRLAVEHAAL